MAENRGRGGRGSTPLAARRLGAGVQFLAESGADLHVLNDQGQTPLAAAGVGGGDDNSSVELLHRLADE